MLARDVNLNPRPITGIDNNNMCDDLPVRYCYLCIDWNENYTSFDFDISNSGNKLSMFKNRGMHFIHLNVIVSYQK